MSEVSREEFEALKARVEELESQESATETHADTDGLDRRDRKVLTHMKNNGVKSRLALVKLYKRITDVTNTNTAKQRAQNLEQHPAYRELVE